MADFLTDKPAKLERAFLVGVQTSQMAAGEAVELLAELKELVENLRIAVTRTELVNLRRATPSLLLGSGKAQELVNLAQADGADVIVFDEALSPAQQRNWEELSGLAVIDRPIGNWIFRGSDREGSADHPHVLGIGQQGLDLAPPGFGEIPTKLCRWQGEHRLPAQPKRERGTGEHDVAAGGGRRKREPFDARFRPQAGEDFADHAIESRHVAQLSVPGETHDVENRQLVGHARDLLSLRRLRPCQRRNGEVRRFQRPTLPVPIRSGLTGAPLPLLLGAVCVGRAHLNLLQNILQKGVQT